LFEGADLVDPFGVGDIPFEPGELVDPARDKNLLPQKVCRGRPRTPRYSPLGVRELGGLARFPTRSRV
jgi:hypothetical protein